jgi:hypothetical protein
MFRLEARRGNRNDWLPQFDASRPDQVTLDDIRAADYNLSPSQFVEVNDKVNYRPLSEILAD